MAKSPLSGPHHCIGTARSVVDLVFRHLHDCCAPDDGSLNRGDLEAARVRLLNDLTSSNLDWIENVFSRCLDANTHAPFVLERHNILSKLLLSGSEAWARTAFDPQVARYGQAWLCLQTLCLHGFGKQLARSGFQSLFEWLTSALCRDIPG